MAPLDSDGNFCGLGNHTDYPLLYYYNIDTPVWFPYAVCVKECPTAQDIVIDCMPTENVPVCDKTTTYPPYETMNVFDIWCIPVFDDLSLED